MSDRFDYGQNPEKTLDGALIRSYECDPLTADSEFLLSKARYKSITGREQKRDADVLCYQIRQSFPPGELDPEEALNIGYELAMRWTKGKHAFFVVSHADRPHPHVHIYYNSTTLDCTRKYRDFLGSARALRRLSDRICLEHDLSVIKNPKLHSKGKFQHYGQWLGAPAPLLQGAATGDHRRGPGGSARRLCRVPPADGGSGGPGEAGRGGVISFRLPGQDRATGSGPPPWGSATGRRMWRR